MGFFKEFKEDLSQAVNNLVTEPELENGDAPKSEIDNLMVNTLDDPELAEMAASFEKQAMEEMQNMTANLTAEVNDSLEEERRNISDDISMDSITGSSALDSASMNKKLTNIEEETAIITQGLTITGDLISKGSIDVFGTVTGNVSCTGKLTVTGNISGDVDANEIFANDAKIDGNLVAKGSVKIGQGSVVVGNVTATSAVFAGAVKGDIDVNGPVIIDASAIIVGDIKSKAVQINNGATIDGRCSQCYADVNTEAIFDIKAK